MGSQGVLISSVQAHGGRSKATAVGHGPANIVPVRHVGKRRKVPTKVTRFAMIFSRNPLDCLKSKHGLSWNPSGAMKTFMGAGACLVWTGRVL